MGTRAVLACVAIEVVYILGAFGREECYSPQFAEIGKKATIECSFQEGFFAVAWFNSTETVLNEPLVNYQQSVKSGIGYSSGLFDIRDDGSLLINNVSLEDDHVFAVTKLEAPFSNFTPRYVHVVVIVKPLHEFPVIDQCGNQRNICLQRLVYNQAMSCHVADSRPSVNLSWVIRNDEGDFTTPNELSFQGSKSHLYNTSVITKNTFKEEMVLGLLVCKELGPPFLLPYAESLILLQRDDSDISTQPVKKHFELSSRLDLTCSLQNVLFLVWDKLGPVDNPSEPLLYAILLGNRFEEILHEDFMLGNDGSLVVPKLGFQHEGIYECSFGNGKTGGRKSFDVEIFVSPTPIYPQIDGCDHRQYCVLEVTRIGNLTCSLKGVRPKVKLHVETIQKSSLTELRRNEDEHVTSYSNGTFDIVLTSHYVVGPQSQNRLTMKCSITGTGINELRLSTTFDLLFIDDQTSKAKFVQLPIFTGIVAIMVVVAVLLLSLPMFFCYKRNCQLKTSTGTPNVLHLQQQIPLLATRPGLETFLQELKVKYQSLYNSVQPIPYVRDRLRYCVERVFVEGGLEWFSPQGGSTEWVRVSSYKTICEDSEYTRILLEGEPGYGKSTLALQLVYDWCHKVKPMDAVEILIFLRLRQLGGVTSIYRAIRQFILPQDSTFSENEIDQFLKSCSSLVILFDGYDEYPDRDKSSDVMSIISNDMLQKATVILTTRPVFVPEKYSPQTKLMRLIGFDTEARDQYINTAVAGNNQKKAENIKTQLYKNPVVKVILEIPLFFVIFAHILQDKRVPLKLNSVTSFFQYLVTNIHSHEQNKNKYVNVKKKRSNCDHMKLDEAAFKSLQGSEKKIIWSKNDLCRKIGDSLYKQYVETGILVEEEVLVFENTENENGQEYMYYQTQVRFYHQLFCEWYASHFLASLIAKKTEGDLESLLANMDPDDLQFFYRFTCGLNFKSGSKIIKHLQKMKKNTLAILCTVEQDNDIDNVKDTIRRLCNVTTFDTKDSRFLQMSTIQLLEIASTSQIRISFVECYGSFKAINRNEGKIILKSGLFVPYLTTLEELWITEEGREFSTSEVNDILCYASRCVTLKTLVFFRCLLPYNGFGSLPTVLIKRHVQVSWLPEVCGVYRLDLESTKWQVDSKQGDLSATGELKDMEHEELVQTFRQKWRETEFQQSLQGEILSGDAHVQRLDDGDSEAVEA